MLLARGARGRCDGGDGRGVELPLPRGRQQALEDQTSDLQTQMCEMVKEVSIAKRREEEYERRNAEGDKLKAKLSRSRRKKSTN